MIFPLPAPVFPLLLAASLSCPAAPAPAVTLNFQNTAPQYSTGLSAAELGRFRIDTTFSHGPREVFTVGGLTESRIDTKFRVYYKTLTHPVTRETRIWTDRVEIDFSYAPLVYIASEAKPGTCRYRTTGEHELRHVNTDVITLNERMPAVKQAMTAVAATLGVRGPLPAGATKQAEDDFIAPLKSELQRQVADIERLRAARQQQIDTRQEYLRLTAACPEGKKKGR